MERGFCCSRPPEALTVADKLVTEVFLRFGFPAQLHSDQGCEFESQLFKGMCALLGIDKTRTCPNNPKSDGMIECYNRSLLTMLSHFVNENHTNWDDQLPYVMAAYRATEHKSTACTPNLLMLNRETTCPLDLMVGNPPAQEPQECPVAYVEWVRQSMVGAHEVVYDALGHAVTRQSQDYNHNLKFPKFRKGDWVWRYYPPKANQKLGLGWDGPYLVLEALTPWIYKIQKGPDRHPVNIHVDQLKPMEGPDHPDDRTIVEDSTSEMPQEGEELDNTLVAEQPPSPSPSQFVTDGQNCSSPPISVADEPVIPFVPRSRRERRIKPREIYSPG